MTEEQAKTLKKGDKIICNRVPDWGSNYLTKGKVYTILKDWCGGGLLFEFDDGDRNSSLGDVSVMDILISATRCDTAIQSTEQPSPQNTSEPPCCGNYNAHSPDCEYYKWNRERLMHLNNIK